MPYGREGYRKYTMDERVSALLRSIVQDGCNDFKKETINVIFTEKKVDGTDIGKICSKWAFRILGSLDNDNKMQVKLLFFLYILYTKDKNPDVNKTWHLIWMKEACPLFSNKINDLPAAGKVAPLASLEKPEYQEGRDVKSVKW